jgi:CheY-like chemotaxis protein
MLKPCTAGTVLIVEDHADSRDLYVTVFEAAGFRCVAAGDPDEAVRRAATERVDVAILDLGLPRLEDGLALAWRFRSLADAPRLVAVTGHPPERLPRELFSELLMKPVDPADIVALVQQLLDA